MDRNWEREKALSKYILWNKCFFQLKISHRDPESQVSYFVVYEIIPDWQLQNKLFQRNLPRGAFEKQSTSPTKRAWIAGYSSRSAEQQKQGHQVRRTCIELDRLMNTSQDPLEGKALCWLMLGHKLVFGVLKLVLYLALHSYGSPERWAVTCLPCKYALMMIWNN